MTRRATLAAAVVAALGAALVAVAAPAAHGDPLRLRSNALSQSQADTPVGLLTLRAEGAVRTWLSAEAVVWVGAGDEAEADAMVASVKMRDPKHRGELQVGRFVVVPGAVRPIHVDGARGVAFLPWDTSLTLFGGIPVVPEFGANRYDWVVGSRAARQLGDWGSVGVAWMQRRTSGRLDDQEVGVDAGVGVTRWLDVGGRLAYDVVDPGVSDAIVSAAARRGAWRWELFGSHRSASRILPATSLFTVLGDIATEKLGATTRWRAAPRLDVTGTAAARYYANEVDDDDELGVELLLRSVLRLDDVGRRAISLELRREDAPDTGWTGARAALRYPIDDRFTVANELELVVPDESEGRGTVWPWGLAGLTWAITSDWKAAAAIEMSASPQYRYRIDGIARLTRDWGAL